MQTNPTNQEEKCNCGCHNEKHYTHEMGSNFCPCKTSPTQQKNTWEDKLKKTDDFYEETGVYHVDGAEFNVDTDKLIIFIKSLLSQAITEDREVLKGKIKGIIPKYHFPEDQNPRDTEIENSYVRGAKVYLDEVLNLLQE